VGKVEISENISWGFTVYSVENTIETLKKDNIEICGEIFQPNPKIKYFFAKDPNGFKIQFVENVE
jgi:lactoylglutathione lyase